MKKLSTTFIFVIFAFKLSADKYSWGHIKSFKENKTCLEAVGEQVFFKTCESDKPSQRWLYSAEGQLFFENLDAEKSDEYLSLSHDDHYNIFVGSDKPFGYWEWDSVQKSNKRYIILRSKNYPSKCLALGDETETLINRASLRDCTDNMALLELESTDKSSGFFAFPRAALAFYKINTNSWMGQIYKSNSSVSLFSILIPGTHNSATYEGFWPISTTQNQDILEQLESGVRYFDLRIYMGRKGLVINHGPESGDWGSFELALRQIEAFTQKHPKEIVILDLREVPTGRGSEARRNREELISVIAAVLGDQLIEENFIVGQELTLANIWQGQENINTKKRSIILLLQDHEKFNTTKNSTNLKFMWERKKFLEEKWPDSTDFSDIKEESFSGLVERQRQGETKKFFVSQLIRTIQISDVVFSPRLTLYYGPRNFMLEKTSDGYFNYIINNYINYFIDQKLPLNIIETDYYNMTDLVSLIIWQNINKLSLLQNSEQEPGQED